MLPILNDLKSWMTEQSRRLSSKTGLAKALQYALTQWDALCLYTEDGRLGIDNNPAERPLRTIAIIRKNFLLLGSDAGGKHAAVIHTVLETDKLNGLDPEAYLADVIDRMAKGHPINRLSELFPWNWKNRKLKSQLSPARCLAYAYIAAAVLAVLQNGGFALNPSVRRHSKPTRNPGYDSKFCPKVVRRLGDDAVHHAGPSHQAVLGFEPVAGRQSRYDKSVIHAIFVDVLHPLIRR